MIQNKYLKANTIIQIFTIFLFVTSILIITSSYFNNKLIQSTVSQCYKNDGEAILEIHNSLTNDFSFECK